MKRVIFTILLAIIFLTPAQAVWAESDEGYYIQKYYVEVVANPDRSYDVVETIDVFFEEYSHGIYRTIPTIGAEESYTINDLRVEGDPYTLESEGYLRIGDPDVTIIGHKTYVIKYTFSHYADIVPDADYFYMSIIGTEWDVRIEQFSARVTLPDSAEVLEYTLTGGVYGSKGSVGLADIAIEGNEITLAGLGPLAERNGIALNVKLPENTFSKAKKWVPPIEVERLDIFMVIDENGTISVEEKYKAKVNEEITFRRGLYPHLGRYYPETVPHDVANESNTGPDNVTGYGSAVDLNGYAGKTVDFSIRYTLAGKLRENMSQVGFFLSFMNNDKDMLVNELNVEIRAPSDILDFIYDGFGDDGLLREPEINGHILTTSSIEPILNKYVDYVIVLDGAGFVRGIKVLDIALPLALLVIMILCLYWAFRSDKEKPLVPVIGFYPPNGMNPAEIGYIIDNNVNGRDVTSLIYYWASHGHLNIELIDKKNFALHRLSDLDESHLKYEHEMFTAMWAFGAEGVVSNKDLKDNFYSSVNGTASKVKTSFTGERELYRKGRKSKTAVFACLILFPIFIIMTIVWSGLKFYSDEVVIVSFGMFILSVLTLILANGYRNDRYKNRAAGVVKIVICVVIAVIGAALFVFLCGDGKVMFSVSAAISGASIIAIMISVPFFARMSDFGIYVLGLCMGFKLFLTTAEKQRLEMLLNENPNYYYDILPFAQVLGVSKIWQDKFDRLLTRPPSWCYGPGAEVDIFNSSIMSSMMNTMSSDMTSRPSSSGDGGGFSGGGFSSGGFSGGGSGGGGGGRW